MSNLDPVTLTVIQNGLIQVCNEMDLAFVRAAFSPVISEGMDRSDGIYDATDGALIAQGELGLPVFVGTMQFSTRAVIERVKSHYAGKVDPGDVFIVNDPYLGGTHLMGTQHDLRKLVILAGEQYEVGDDAQKATGRNERLYQRLEIACCFFTPVEQALASRVPGSPV